MEQRRFEALLPYISADLVREISIRQNMPYEQAISRLYSSKLYAALEDEETKVWHYSTKMLYALLESEQRSGELRFPDV